MITLEISGRFQETIGVHEEDVMRGGQRTGRQRRRYIRNIPVGLERVLYLAPLSCVTHSSSFCHTTCSVL